MINLAEYSKLDVGGGSKGDFVSFEKTGDTKYLRFMYESGGERIGEDISTRKKAWNAETKKYEYDTDDGTLHCVLNCIEYDADGKNPRRVRWERSAYFCSTILIPMWKNYPRIMDGVWKVTASNPKTLDASYALFPVMNADTIKFPIDLPEETGEKTTSTVEKKSVTTEQAKPKKKYWE